MIPQSSIESVSVTESVILIFAKAPVEGQVKTRLISDLGSRGATQLYRKLLYRLSAALEQGPLPPIELWCSPDTSHEDFQRIASILSCSLRDQISGDLGERMQHAIHLALNHYRHVVLIGVDCPGLTARTIMESICHLQEDEDAVLVPAEDGGYVLLGLNRVADCLFRNIPWGTEKVAATTRECLRSLGWRWCEMPPLWDVDRPEDLLRLRDLEVSKGDD